jgi:hypothetical protein
MRALVLTGVTGAALLVPGPAAGAESTTLFASPTGSGSACTSEAPCDLKEAVAEAVDGDSVQLAPSSDKDPYTLPFGGLEIKNAIDLGAAVGAPAALATTNTASVNVRAKAGASLHDLRLLGLGTLNLESGSADRVFVDYTGEHESLLRPAACELAPGTTLRDSVCWTRESETTDANAIEVVLSGEGLTGTTVLRNDTAIAADAEGSGLFVQAGYGTRISVDAVGVIALADQAPDVTAALVGQSSPEAHLALSHSDYATVAEAEPYATVSAPGSGGNRTAAPIFVDAAIGDFHQQLDSPTIDGGLADGETGPLDLDGGARALPGCTGAAAVPDIGAFEATASAPCPPLPPEPPPPPQPRKPVFRILKVTVHGVKGSVRVETPGPGTVTVTGLGVKLFSRSAAAAGVVTVPIRLWAVTKVRLSRSGRTTIRLKVKFEPSSGPTREKARAVVLAKHRHRHRRGHRHRR